MVLFRHEWKQNIRTLLIWSLAVGIMGMICICLYADMAENMADLSESFSNMGAFSDAFGMSVLGIGTIAGFFATEVGVVHGLGSSMFAAIIAGNILSKEEEGHTGEFLYSLPVSRGKVITAKICSIVSALAVFTAVTCIFYILGFQVIDTAPDYKLFAIFMLSQLLMNLEVMCICIALSAFVKRNMTGAGIGIALFLYVYDLMGRIIPDAKDYLFIGPFSYANATDIFAEQEIGPAAYICGGCLMLIALFITYAVYTKKDLAS
ncbi:MAG: ABC transporter permease [Lachnospiraceae bacterium]|nr:ABC transporter permease [Lachnospiraceae bacterium]